MTLMGRINNAAMERLAKKYDDNPGLLTPLDIFEHVMNDPNMPWGFRVEVAEKAAPYFHVKIPAPPVATDQEDNNDPATVHPPKTLSMAELTLLLIQKLSLTVGLTPDQLAHAINTVKENNNENTGPTVPRVPSDDSSTEG
ncbi:MAG: hypothetical protein ACJ8R9_10870 [Steroidobacteraceae bacterium]